MTTPVYKAIGNRSLKYFINRHNVLKIYRTAVRIANGAHTEEQRSELKKEIKLQFLAHQSKDLDTHALSYLLSDARVKLRSLRELVNMTL